MQRLIIAGGGLSGVLAAMAYDAHRPDVAVTLIEGGERLGGAHTWSFYSTDLEPPAAALIAPFVTHAWEGYDVAFRNHRRTLTTPYRSVTSGQLHDVAMTRLGDRARLGTAIASVDETGVTLGSGERLDADAVIDARGARELAGMVLRWQKFVGREVELSAPHGLTRPTVMDATVPQHDGYRFVYLLPFSPTRLLIEDTYYAETPDVDAVSLSARIDDYAASRGWTIARDIRQEIGALPLLLGGEFETMWRAATAGGAVPVGLRACLFHPVTGYSLPLAARTALALARGGPVSSRSLTAIVEALSRERFKRAKFDRLLNRLLFLSGRPENRHRVLERFHKLPQGLIERFYAGRLERADAFRILMGKPPVPVMEAMRVMSERAAFGR